MLALPNMAKGCTSVFASKDGVEFFRSRGISEPAAIRHLGLGPLNSAEPKSAEWEEPELKSGFAAGVNRTAGSTPGGSRRCGEGGDDSPTETRSFGTGGGLEVEFA